MLISLLPLKNVRHPQTLQHMQLVILVYERCLYYQSDSFSIT